VSNVRVLIGDLFRSDAQTLTNTVNTVGVMGKGIALEFKKRFPGMYDDYVARCEAGEVRLGQPYLFKPLVPPWILNFPTKEHWRSLSRIDAIREGLEFLEVHYLKWGIESLAVPPLGCGEGGLEWRIVGSTLYRGLTRLSIPVELYAPFGTPHDELTPEFLGAALDLADTPVSRVPAAGVALASTLERIASQNHHYPIGRIGMQKLAYFATRAGIPTELEFERRPYGPFADGMKKLLSKLINNGLIEERKRGQMFVTTPGPTLADAKRAFSEDLERWEPAMDRVADLFLRLPSTRRAELAASVHYVAESLENRNRARRGAPVAEPELVDLVERWKQGRTPRPTEDEIVTTARTLAYLRWIDVAPADEDEALLGV